MGRVDFLPGGTPGSARPAPQGGRFTPTLGPGAALIALRRRAGKP